MFAEAEKTTLIDTTSTTKHEMQLVLGFDLLASRLDHETALALLAARCDSRSRSLFDYNRQNQQCREWLEADLQGRAPEIEEILFWTCGDVKKM